MFSNDLGEEHLPDSDHATPSSVTDVWTVDFVGKLWETRAVGEPRSGPEYFEDILGNVGKIGLFGEEGVSKDVDLIAFFESWGFFVFFEVAKNMVPEIEGEVLDALSKGRLSQGHVIIIKSNKK